VISAVCLSVIQSVRLSVCLCVCVYDYCKSSQLIPGKLGVMTNRKNRFTFGGDPVLDTDYRSLFYFPRHYGIADFRRFISISHTVTGRFSQHSAK